MKLESRQIAMKNRQDKQVRRGRPRLPTPNLDAVQQKVIAHILLEKGLALTRVAARLKVDVQALALWDKAGRPLTRSWDTKPFVPATKG